MSTETLLKIFLTGIITSCATIAAFYIQWRYIENINQIRRNLSALILYKTIIELDETILSPIVNDKQIPMDAHINPLIPLNLSISLTEFGDSLCLLPNIGTRLFKHLLYREQLASSRSGLNKQMLNEYIAKDPMLIQDLELAIEKEKALEKESFLKFVFRSTYKLRRY